jgi:hypothetical protein
MRVDGKNNPEKISRFRVAGVRWAGHRGRMFFPVPDGPSDPMFLRRRVADFLSARLIRRGRRVKRARELRVRTCGTR